MLNQSFDHVLKKGDSKYTLVMLASKRARQLVDNAEPLVKTESTKPVSIAIEEIVAGEITYTIGHKTDAELELDAHNKNLELERANNNNNREE